MSRRKQKDPFEWLNERVAPETAIGLIQIIPTAGEHTQFFVDDWTIRKLVLQDKVVYDPEYGPGANVYRPVGTVDAETVKEWLQ